MKLSTILEETNKLSSEEEKVAFLRQHYHKAFHEALAFGYDERIKWTLPETDPPFRPSSGDEFEPRFFQECKMQKLYYFVEGGKAPNLTALRREDMFIQLLESIDYKDAELVLTLKNKSLPAGITRDLIEKAYGKL